MEQIYKLKISDRALQNKPDAKEVNNFIQPELKKKEHVECTINEFAKCIAEGKAFYVCDFKEIGEVRESNVNKTWFLGLDIDNKISKIPLNMADQKEMKTFIEDVKNDYGFTPIIAYNTFSHDEKECNKFRLLYKFERSVSAKEYKIIYQVFLDKYNKEIPYLDNSTKNVNRLWFGTNKKVHVYENYIPISTKFIENALNSAKEKKIKKNSNSFISNKPIIRQFEEGSRNSNLHNYLSGKINKEDFRDYDTLMAHAKVINETRCNPPLEDEEVETIVNSVYKDLQNGNYEVKDEEKEKEREIVNLLESNKGSNIFENLLGNIETLYNNGGINKISTGFPQLDKKIGGGLYSGLYIVGAGSSIGKTTFIQQIADNIAEEGQKVLFFSLEMGKNEMLSKTIVREIYKRNRSLEIGSRDLLNGVFNEDIWKKLVNNSDIINKITQNIHYIEGTFETTIKDIVNISTKFKEIYGQAPVIIVDYLQVIAPVNVRLGDKQNVDMNISELKRLSRNLDTPVIAISSVNRQNYLSYIDFQSFKESGSIEYGADVVIGLQLNAIHEIAQMRESQLNEKREVYNKAKSETPREVEVVILKNRYGTATGTHNYQYEPKYNLFSEMDWKPKGQITKKELNLFEDCK